MARTNNKSSKSSSKGNKRKASDASIDNTPLPKKNKNDQQHNLPTEPKNDTMQCCEWPVTTFLFQAEYGFINNPHYDPLIDTEDTEKIRSLEHLLSLFEENYMPIVTNNNSLINKNVVVSQSNFFQNDKLYSTPLYFNLQGQHPLTVTMIGRQKIRLLAPATTKAAYLCTYDLDENKKLSEPPFNNWTVYPTKSSPVKKSKNTLFATLNDEFHLGPTIQRRLFWVTINKKEEEESSVIAIHCLDDIIDNFEDLTRNNRTVLYRKKLWTEVENLPTKIITNAKTTLLDLRQDGLEHTGLPEQMTVSIVDSINNVEALAVTEVFENDEMENEPSCLSVDDMLSIIKQQVPNNIVETIGETFFAQPTDFTTTTCQDQTLPICLEQTLENESNIICSSEESVKTSMANSIIHIGSQAVTAPNEKLENDDIDVFEQLFSTMDEMINSSPATFINKPLVSQPLTDFNFDSLLSYESLGRMIANLPSL